MIAEPEGSVAGPIARDDLLRVARHLVTAGAPGAAAMVQDERGVRQAAGGMAELATARPMQPHLRFRAGSVTKSVVAALILRLTLEGRLTLDDTIERWLPSILPYGHTVTIRQLLNHTGGVPDYPQAFWDHLLNGVEGRFRSWTPRELVGLVAEQPLERRPGAGWSYSNIGYILLGLIAEAATGKTLSAELSRVILRPLGLHATSFPVDVTALPDPSSHGYSPRLKRGRVSEHSPLEDVSTQNPSWAWAAGALVSNLGDLCRFFAALLDGRLLPPESLAEMLATVTVPPDVLPLPLFGGYGLGIVKVDTPAGPLFGEPGGIPGFLNMVLSTPDGARQAGLMINVGAQAPAHVITAFATALRELGTRLGS